jgi:DNA repair exonuclease SbcCD ATPase subunit
MTTPQSYEERAWIAENKVEKLQARMNSIAERDSIAIVALHERVEELKRNEDTWRSKAGEWKLQLDRAEADLAAVRALLLEAREKCEWIGCSEEGYDEMIRQRDEFIARIDAVLAGQDAT